MQKSASFSGAQKSPQGPSRTSSGPLRPSKCMLFLKENNTFRKATFSLRVASRIEKVSKTTSKWLPDGAQNDQKCIQKRGRKNNEKMMQKWCQNDLKMEPKGLPKFVKNLYSLTLGLWRCLLELQDPSCTGFVSQNASKWSPKASQKSTKNRLKSVEPA